jgi:hypothetical protein
MNSIFTLLVLTSPGMVSEAYTFQSLKQCESVKAELNLKGVCIEKKQPSVEEQMRMMIQLMKTFQKEFDEANR